MRNNILAGSSALLLPILLIGCTGLQEKMDDRFDAMQSKTDRLVKDVGQVEARGGIDSTVVHEKGIWIGKGLVSREAAVLPPIFFEPATFDRSVASLAEVAERITLRSGIPVKVARDIYAGSTAAGQPAGAGQPGDGGAAPAASRPGSGSTNPNAPAGQGTGPIRITYFGGNFKGLLDMITARFGIYWKYADGVINFYHTDTRTFQINAIPGDAALNATVVSGSISGQNTGTGTGDGQGGQSGGVNASNSQNTAVKSTLSVFSGIEKAVAGMLSPYGRVTASPATGSITVTDSPDKLERVAKFIEQENKSLSQQVMINVTVLAVNVGDTDSYGINWNLVYTDLSRRFGMSSAFVGEQGATAMTASVLSSSSSKWAGSSAVIDALSKQGNVRRETTASVVTLNNQPVPVQVAKQTAYLKATQTTLTANVGSTTTLTPGQVTSGFNMTILPHVLRNGTVLLQFSADISSLVAIRRVTSDSSSIESPELDTRNFLQRVAMKSNETLIISGFEQTDDNLERQGLGQPRNYLLGGGYKARANKEVIVILITPVAVNGAS